MFGIDIGTLTSDIGTLTSDIATMITSLNNTKDIIMLTCMFMVLDVATGYLKALKNKKLNSSISRDGFIKKLGWVSALLAGLAFKLFIHTDSILIGSALICIGTEGISVYENLYELGIKLPFSKYFEKIVNVSDTSTIETKVETTTEDKDKEEEEYEDI